MPLSPNKTVFRLRRCPGDRDISSLRELLSKSLQDVSTEDIRIQSLAADYGVCNTTKTATLMFHKLPGLVEDHPKQKQWKIPLDDGCADLLLDIEFGGFTPLNDPEPGKHEFDCIVISGLASHPFGSWQPKGNDKTYMWVRDTLPRQLPHVRAILYGYDTTLVDSYSFQSIAEVASTLIDHLMPTGWQSSEMKPLVFLAHSLGGIVLKQMLVTLNKRELSREMLNRARGGILFGVPSQGMAQGPLLAMVRDRPNEALVRDLAIGSPYLHNLDEAFGNIGRGRQMIFHWAYETTESPTVEQLDDGTFSRTGPRDVLVNRESATRGLWNTSHHDDLFAIDEDHSEMVKFQDGSSMCEQVVLKRLERICNSQLGSQTALPRRTATVSKRKRPEAHPETQSTKEWSLTDLQDSFLVPEWDSRYKAIEDNTPGTFEWFKTDMMSGSGSKGFFHWLQDDEEQVCWIHGKPQSGKSTLMKYIAKDSYTERCLTVGVSGVTEIKVRHFFYDRGTILQRSFEGMLKSMLYQIIQGLPPLAQQLTPLLKGKPNPDLHEGWTVNELQRCLHLLLKQNDHDIRIFLVIDAMDDYDGGPRYMTRFLKNLVDAAGDRTRVKMLLSSRTWYGFLEVPLYGSLPPQPLECFTVRDIRDYCKDRLDKEPEAWQFYFEGMIPLICVKSQGVFSWAKLVLEQLIATRPTDADEASCLLRSLPQDLSDYYEHLVASIPRERRWYAYVVIQFAYVIGHLDSEVVPGVHLMELFRIIHIADCQTYEHCKERLENWDTKFYPNGNEVALRAIRAAGWTANLGKFDMYDGWLFEHAADRDYLDKNIALANDICGGLIKITRPETPSLQQKINKLLTPGTPGGVVWELEDDPWYHCVQFSHESVRNFVEMPNFKELLLGSKASSVVDNGYTFLAKSYLTRGRGEPAQVCCQLSEKTTGHSLAGFIQTLDQKAFERLATIPFERRSLAPTYWCGVMLPLDPLTFAISYNLPICLDDLLMENSKQLKSTPHALLKGWPINSEGWTQAQAWITTQLFETGYTLDETKAEFQDMLWIIGAMQYTDLMSKWHRWLGPSTRDKASMLLAHGQDPNVLLYGERLLPGKRVKSTSVKYRAMHVADYDFAVSLFEWYADVNLEDGRGNTPLDWMLAHKDSPKGRKRRGLNHGLFLGAREMDSELRDAIHQKIMFLIRNGGRCKTTSMDVWQKYIEDSWNEVRPGGYHVKRVNSKMQDPNPVGLLEYPGTGVAKEDTKPDDDVNSPTDSAVAFGIDEELTPRMMRRQMSLFQKELEADLAEIECFLASTEAADTETASSEVASSEVADTESADRETADTEVASIAAASTEELSTTGSVQEEVKTRRISQFFKRLSVQM